MLDFRFRGFFFRDGLAFQEGGRRGGGLFSAEVKENDISAMGTFRSRIATPLKIHDKHCTFEGHNAEYTKL